MTDVTVRAGRPGSRRGSARADVLVVLGTFLALGVVGGVLWWLLVDPAAYTKLRSGGSMSELQLGKQFGADGWYAVIALVAGLLAGGLLTWWRSRDYLLTTVLVALGSVVAAAVMAGTGGLLGPGNTEAALAAAPVGALVPVPLQVTGWAVYLVWPVAGLVGALMVLWSSNENVEA